MLATFVFAQSGEKRTIKVRDEAHAFELCAILAQTYGLVTVEW